MSPGTDMKEDTSVRFPRVSGDEPRMMRIAKMTAEFSPRERG